MVYVKEAFRSAHALFHHNVSPTPLTPGAFGCFLFDMGSALVAPRGTWEPTVGCAWNPFKSLRHGNNPVALSYSRVHTVPSAYSSGVEESLSISPSVQVHACPHLWQLRQLSCTNAFWRVQGYPRERRLYRPAFPLPIRFQSQTQTSSVSVQQITCQ